MKLRSGLLYIICLISLNLSGQEEWLTGVEFSIDQDNFADFLREDSIQPYRNYIIGMRIGIYGEIANQPILGLPWVRDQIDYFLFDNILYNSGFNEEKVSHNFAFITHGITPSHISDLTEGFTLATAEGYDLLNDIPFASFTGFRSTRRLEGYKGLAHSAGQLDIALNTSFTFGFGSLGMAHWIDDLFGGGRPDGVLWDKDDNRPYPTGQSNFSPIPMFMYSVSAEAVVLRPMRQVVVQVRPEANLGYQTNFGIGLDLGKVMNVERMVDNLSYTDPTNPSLVAVNGEPISIAVSAGANARLILYDQLLNGFFSGSRHHIPMGEMRRFVFEWYAGVKMQFFKKIELSFSINRRTSPISVDFDRQSFWGTLGIKYLIGEEGEGCYD